MVNARVAHLFRPLKAWSSKGTVFFFPGKVCGPIANSFLRNFVLFFRRQGIFFFLRKVCKPLTRQKNCIYEKSSKKHKTCIFPRLAVSFFILKSSKIFCFFFLQNFAPHSLTRFQTRKKKHSEKNSIFTHRHDLYQRVVKIKLFQEEKIQYLWLKIIVSLNTKNMLIIYF